MCDARRNRHTALPVWAHRWAAESQWWCVCVCVLGARRLDTLYLNVRKWSEEPCEVTLGA